MRHRSIVRKGRASLARVTVGAAVVLLGSIGLASGGASASPPPQADSRGCPEGQVNVVPPAAQNGMAYCTHGGDARAAFSNGNPNEEIGPDGTPVPAQAASGGGTNHTFPSYTPLTSNINQCPGDGVAGERVHFFYAYSGTNRIANGTYTKSQFRTEIGYADTFIDSSDASWHQHIRSLCSGSLVTVTEIQCPADSNQETTMYTVITCLRNAGYDGDENNNGVNDYDEATSHGEVYVAFLDGYTSSSYGGMAQTGGTDSTSAAGRGGKYAVLWNYSGATLLHELMHTLGAVQNSAPHSSQNGHCFDEYDVMCYQDGGSYFTGGGTIQYFCSDIADNLNFYDVKVDCGHNKNQGGTAGVPGEDYWHPGTPTGYLATHWNTAKSRFLTTPNAK